MIALKNVLVATDFSAPSEAALTYGRALARNFGGKLHVLHIVERVPYPMGIEGFAPPPADLQREIEDGAQKQMAATVGEDDRRELQAVGVVRIDRTAAQGIVDYAAEAKVDLIIVGTHGRGGMSHLLLGSVAERVLRMAPCPVLTVRHPEREFVMPDMLAKVTPASR